MKTPDPLYLSYELLRCAADKRRSAKRRELFRLSAKSLRDLDLRLAELEKTNNQPGEQP